MPNINETLRAIRDDFRRNLNLKVILDRFNIDLSFSYLHLDLRCPILIAPGPLTQSLSRIKEAADAGYGGVVLKSVVGEDRHGNASMKMLRKRSTFARWVYDDEGNPIFHWNGGLDLRDLREYLKFAREAFRFGRERNFPVIPSFLCHLPQSLDEEWRVEEWEYTTRMLIESASIYYGDLPVIAEIDFCPFLKREKLAVDREVVLRWYREAPKLVKEASSNVQVVPKLLNLDFGLDFQMEMIRAARDGGADGVVIANRFFRKYTAKNTGETYFTAHGGMELRLINQKQIREARRITDMPISATGGTYSGRHIIEYLSLGAQNVQVLTYVMKRGFKEAFEDLIFNPKDGFVKLILEGEIY